MYTIGNPEKPKRDKELLESIMNLCSVLDEIAYQAEFSRYNNLRKAIDRLYNAAEQCLHTDAPSALPSVVESQNTAGG